MLFLLSLAVSAPVYVQASSINIRATPDAKGELITTAAMATKCEELEKKDVWSKLRCPYGEGWAKRELLSNAEIDAKAQFAAFSAKFNDKALKPEERMQAAERALALSSATAPWPEKDIPASDLQALYLETETERLYAALKKPKSIRKVRFKFGKDTSDHEAAMRHQLARDHNVRFPKAYGERGFAWRFFPDGTMHVLLFIWTDMNSADILRDAMLPLSDRMARAFTPGQKEFDPPCWAAQVEWETLVETKGCPLDVSMLNAFGTCQQSCNAACNKSRLDCDMNGGRNDCVAFCVQERTNCSEDCYKEVKDANPCKK